MEFSTDQKVKKAELSLVIKRADGRVEDLGVVARYQPDERLNEDKKTLLRRVLALTGF